MYVLYYYILLHKFVCCPNMAATAATRRRSQPRRHHHHFTYHITIAHHRGRWSRSYWWLLGQNLSGTRSTSTLSLSSSSSCLVCDFGVALAFLSPHTKSTSLASLCVVLFARILWFVTFIHIIRAYVHIYYIVYTLRARIHTANAYLYIILYITYTCTTKTATRTSKTGHKLGWSTR